MKQLLVISSVLILTGCSTVPILQSFPDIPPALKKSCADLEIVPGGTDKLSEVLTVVSENYARYHECSALNQAWQQWYSEQRKIFESVK